MIWYLYLTLAKGRAVPDYNLLWSVPIYLSLSVHTDPREQTIIVAKAALMQEAKQSLYLDDLHTA